MAEVFFSSEISSESVFRLYQKVSKGISGKIAIKLHFGEKGNRNYLSPQLVTKLASQTKATLVDTNVLYLGPRRQTESHLALAKEHGFDFAPLHILDADGEFAQPVAGGKHFKEVRLPEGIRQYDSFIIYSHFKGHIMSGFGGAIKNVGMGMASIPGKMAQHSSTVPLYNSNECVNCGICLQNCPGDAIRLNPVYIHPKLCIGCGKCIGVCPQHVFDINWSSTKVKIFQERMAEYAWMIGTAQKMVFINVIANISRLCDCDKNAPAPFVRDIGILASTDMVAIDQASLDLVNKKTDCEDAFALYSGVSGYTQIKYARKLGLGSTDYKLIDTDLLNG